MAFNGFFQALPQVVVGAINPRNDVGMAMDYLRLSRTVKTAAALVALAAIPPIALWLTRSLLSLAEDPAPIASARARTRFIFYVAALPALIAIPLILLFRVPREWVEVVMPPVVVTVIGIAWIQAGVWHVRGVRADGGSGTGSVAYPLGAAPRPSLRISSSAEAMRSVLLGCGDTPAFQSCETCTCCSP